MAVGPETFPHMYPVAGVGIGVAEAGIKRPGRRDVVVFSLAEGGAVAGVFTRNAFCAAPVHLCKARLQEKAAVRYLLINTGNANAGTGPRGMQDAMRCCNALAGHAGVTENQVMPFSTGVIGEPLPVTKIEAVLPTALERVAEDNWENAAWGIMTTDTRPKGASVQLSIDGKTVTITGISKGAGMIKPNMATMLGFVATDAAVDQALLQQLASAGANQSFNRITIDGDTSTNDSLILMASGASGVELDESHANFIEFRTALFKVMQDLAHAIVKDGEGATKFVTVRVEDAVDSEEALKVAYAIAHSPLVKTAMSASDPNWGRILAAVGYAGVHDLDVTALQIWLDDVCIVKNGGRAESYTEEQGQAVMSLEAFTVRVNLTRGGVTETVWTTDLTQEYVSINADYRS
ncbi:bifunctional ornithine acetyltransferase/N-acetylglutamate synthase [Pokkaliibacter plantistimulans]|uniref:Arginine biosynthesis bifunctional protein ArgJ n=1 Tax=Proteobacteria bacterium 228 TaxID=2083153 RepID=A0A2S5KJ14_9PROT|nr:bifunctional glutamate N-acetyltransferase/amino-acid acetyltransferase ArgJ [Pokkaliibacter plantistimulans]PPC74814.1 bifunctional ornithine acetyltransferase/N-acetylglutamate synthase [Pokkaliibacter plantistimulans]